MLLTLVRCLADVADSDWEQLARADADPLHLSVRLGVSEDVVAQKMADAHIRILIRCHGKALRPAMTPLLQREDFLRSNFGSRLRA